MSPSSSSFLRIPVPKENTCTCDNFFQSLLDCAVDNSSQV